MPIDDIDRLFALAPATAASAASRQAGGASSADSKSSKKQAQTTLIDLQRAQNISIILTRIKPSFAQVRAALLEVDSDVLTLDHLRALKGCLPTVDEMELVRDYDGDVSSLSKADQFFKAVLGIPKLHERLQAMVYMRKFDVDVEEIKPDLQVFRRAIDEMRGSDKFRAILATVLQVGNVLNASTFRGSAVGFQLGDLLKLRETRCAVANDGSINTTPTLLHFVVKVLNDADNGLVGFLDECPNVEAAARLSTHSVMASVKTVVSGLDQVRDEVKFLSKMRIASANDRFVEVGSDFVKKNEALVKSVKLAGEEVKRDLAKMLGYYGFASDDQPPGPQQQAMPQTKPEDFFGLISSFGQAMMRAEVEVLEAERREADRKKKFEESEKKRRRLEAGRPFVLPEPVGPEVRGPLASVREEENRSSEDGTGGGGTVKRAPLAPAQSPNGSSSIEDETPTPTASKPGSRFRSWGASAVATLDRVQDQEEAGEEEAAVGRESTLKKAHRREGSRRSYGRRGHLDEVLKDLRSGGGGANARMSLYAAGNGGTTTMLPSPSSSSSNINHNALSNGGGSNTISGRKSLRVKAEPSHRPLSRVFLTGD